MALPRRLPQNKPTVSLQSDGQLLSTTSRITWLFSWANFWRLATFAITATAPIIPKVIPTAGAAPAQKQVATVSFTPAVPNAIAPFILKKPTTQATPAYKPPAAAIVPAPIPVHLAILAVVSFFFQKDFFSFSGGSWLW
ncbi:15357_t:CDS:2 [Gigaspora margarita]|uniref:15357_t:CDS:1 n=1 Tax=Gigaspora margarita TaxID=4874 RepID=A0ABN7UPN8_GIGMA|nr:15357_t:CDS:2 [Gigaspora margarita]